MRYLQHTALFVLPSVIGIFVFFIFSIDVFAENTKYTPLVTLPGINTSGAESLGEYINALYTLTISLGALIGVFRFSLAGVKYAMSDVVTSKEDAREDMKGVLIGLAILLLPFTVLYTINPNLVNLNVLKLEQKIELGKSTPSNSSLNSKTKEETCPRQYATEDGSTRITSWNIAECKKWCDNGKPGAVLLSGDPPKCRYNLP